MLNRMAFRKSLLLSTLAFLLSAPAAFSDVAPVTVSSVQSAANTGAATTSIPIDVPPGRKGIQPNLALTYNSNGPNGWLGVGWSLDMGAIQRSTKRGVSYSANDYVFTSGGGSSELVARGDWGTGYYGAKMEGAFSKYYYNSSTGGWEVTTKDGTKYYYGATAASRQDSALGVFKWCLDKVQDVNGNYMTVSYWKDQGEIYLDRIDYTGNAGLSPTNYVKFYLEARNDTPPYRLKTIEVYGNGQLAREYALSYNYSAGTSRSLLASVTQYGSDGVTTLPVQTMTWHGGANGWASINGIPTFSPGQGYSDNNTYPIFTGDFNGDGRTDVGRVTGSGVAFFVSDGNGGWTQITSITTFSPAQGYTNASTYPIFTGDFNGDGRTDIARVTGSGVAFFVSGGGAGWAHTWTQISSITTFSPAQGYTNASTYPMVIGDFNGDGRTDVGRVTGSGVAFFVSNGAGGWTQIGSIASLSPGQGFSNVSTYPMVIGDFNGDGRSDVGRVNCCGVSFYFSDGNGGWIPTSGLAGTFSPGQGFSDANTYPIFTGDFNGDGRTDIGRVNCCGVSIYLSDGNGGWIPTSGLPGTFSPGQGFSNAGTYPIFTGDFNGDGKTDIGRVNCCGVSFYFSDGKGGWIAGNGLSGTLSPGQGFSNDSTYPLVTGDFNGDGKVDLARVSCCNVYCFQSTPYFVDLLSTFSNGLGATTTITYAPSSSYTNGLLPFVVQTVSSITVDDGNGNTSTTSYTYAGGLYDATDKEFRGFSYVKATDPSSHTTETWFKQDAVYKGLPYDQIFKSSSGSTYTRTVNTYQSTSPYSGVSFPYLSQRDDYIYDTYATPKRIYSVFTYDGYGNVTRKYSYGDAAVTGDERDEYTEYGYDTANWIVALPNHTYVLDSGGVKKAEGWFTYDAKGNLLTKTAWLNGGTNPVVTYTYDAYGNQTTVKDARNYTGTIAYDTPSQTFPVTVTNALGHSATKTWDYRYGKPLTETDANGNIASYIYDVFGRVTKVTGPLDTGSPYGTVSYYYQNFGAVGSQKVTAYRTEQSGTSNVIWEETYFDGLGRTIKSRREGPDGKVIITDLKYNRRGLMTQRSLPYFEGQTVYKVYLDYDPLGRLVKATNPDGTETSQGYNRGRTWFRDANDYKKVEEKDAWGRLVKVEEYKNAGDAATLWTTTTYQYDVTGNLLKTIDVKGNQTVMTYDTLGRKIAMTDPDMGSWSYGYDVGGNLISQTDAKGQAITFTYDALNRITKKDYPTGTDAVYTYDETTSTNGKGRLTTLVDAAGTTKYWYDTLGRTTKSTRTIDAVAYTTETTYDALSRITSVRYPDNDTVSYSYDTGGNLSQISGYGTYGNYNALGQAGTITYPNGVTTTYQYIATNSRLYSITTATATQGLMNTSYTYDNVGNILGITDYLDSTRNQTFQYDHLNRLTQAASTAYGTLTYAYSMIGNMTSKEGISYTYPTSGNPRPHAVTATSDGKTYVYDANGNMTTDGTRTIAYDYDNMPSSITRGDLITTFVYDASGRRVKKSSFFGTTVYVGKLYECNNGSCTKYIMANGNKLAWKNADGTFYYHQDHLGSSRVITDAAGTKAEEITYLPYGATLTDSGNGTVSVEHRFTSQEFDAETGLYYYNARYYNPGLGRFISADSIVTNPSDPQDLNRYTYAGNNPLRYTDPTGHSKLSKGLKKLRHYVRQHEEIFAVFSPYLYAYGQSPNLTTQVTIAVATYYAAGAFIQGAGITSAIAKAGVHATAGALSGGVSSSINHTDIGQGMLAGAIAGGISSYAGGYIPKGFGYQLAGRTLIGGVTGGISAEIYGGKFSDGFVRGGITGAALYLFNECAHGCIELSGNKGSAIIIQGNSLYNEKYSYVQDGQLKETLSVKDPTFFKVSTDVLTEVMPAVAEVAATRYNPYLGFAVKAINWIIGATHGAATAE